MLGGGLVTSFVYTLGSKFVVSEGYVGGPLVSLTGGETYVAVLVQEDLM